MKNKFIGMLSLMLVLSIVPVAVNAEESISNSSIGDDMIVVEEEEFEEKQDDEIEVVEEIAEEDESNKEDIKEEVVEELPEQGNKEELETSEKEELEKPQEKPVEEKPQEELTEEIKEENKSDYLEAKKAEDDKSEVPEKEVKLVEEELDESEIAKVRTEAEFLRAFQDNRIKEIIITSANININGYMQPKRNTDLKIRSVGLKSKLTFNSQGLLSSSYSSLSMNGGSNLIIKDVDIQAKTSDKAGDGYLFKIDNGNIAFINSVISGIKNTELVRGVINDSIHIENSNIETAGQYIFNVESPNTVTVNLAGASNNLSSRDKSIFLLKKGMHTIFEGNNATGTVNTMKTFGDDSIIQSTGDVQLNNIDFSEARVDKNYIVNANGLVYVDNTKILKLSSGRDYSGFINANYVTLNNSEINTDGRIGNFIKANKAEIMSTKANLRMEKGAVSLGNVPGFFDGNELEITQNSDLVMRTAVGGLDNITPFTFMKMNDLLVDSSNIFIDAKESGLLGGYDGSIIHSTNSADGDESNFTFSGGSKVTVKSQSTKSLFKIGTGRNKDSLKFIVEDPGTELNIASYKIDADNEGIIKLLGVKKQSSTDETGFYVRNGAKMNVSGRGRLVYSDIKNGGYFSVTGEGSELNFEQISGANTNALLFNNGGQGFEVLDKGQIKIIASDASSSAMKMASGNNAINVKTGGHFILDKDGDRALIDSKSNAAIEFSGKNNSFNVQDKGSYINLFSNQGPIVIGTGSFLEMINLPQVDVNINDEGSFIARGKTGSTLLDPWATAGIFNISQFRLNSNGPGYLDLSNKRNGGQGRVLSKHSVWDVGTANSFELNNSNFSLWKVRDKDSNYDNNKYNPDRTWAYINVRASGNSLDNAVSTGKGTGTYIMTNGGLTNFSRISGNNLLPEVRGLHRISDTDRYIYGKVEVPNLPDYSEFRAAWDDEIYVNIEQKNDKGEVIKYHLDLPTVGLQNASKYKFNVYDFESADKTSIGAGHFRIDLGENNFANKGDSYEIVDAYIIRETYDSNNVIIDSQKINVDLSLENIDIENHLALKQTVYDKTPPEAVSLSENLYLNSTSISGEASNDSVKVEMYDSSFNKLSEVDVVNGKWELSLPSDLDLTIGDEYIFVAIDKEGNSNPFTESKWHDATFAAATRTLVEEEKYIFEGNNLFYHVDDVELQSLVDNEKILEKMEIKVIDKDANKEVEFDFVSEDGFDASSKKTGRFYFRINPKDNPKAKKMYFIEVYDDTNHFENDEYIIYAHQFYSSKNAVELTDDELIKLSDARAINKSTGGSVEVEVQDRSKLTGNMNIDNFVTFSVKGSPEVKVEVKVILLDFDNVIQEGNTIIMANDFIRPLYEFKGPISDSEIIKLSNAKAYTVEKYEMTAERNINVDSHTIELAEGLYTADLSAGNEK